MRNAVMTLTKQQVIWLKDLIRADIGDWQSMASRPVDEVGVKFSHLAKTRIDNMENLLDKLDAIEAISVLRKVRKKGLIPEIVCNADDILAVVFGD